ncbi:hypothetical protein AAMO2058_000447800 [Amorphochlora amoebiformis]
MMKAVPSSLDRGYRMTAKYSFDTQPITSPHDPGANARVREVVSTAVGLMREIYESGRVHRWFFRGISVRVLARGGERNPGNTTISQGEKSETLRLVHNLRSRHPNIESVTWQPRTTKRQVSAFDTYFSLYGPTALLDTIAGVNVSCTVDSYMQSNPFTASEMYTTMLEWTQQIHRLQSTDIGLAIVGRDASVPVKLLGAIIKNVRVRTTCPLVLKDIKASLELGRAKSANVPWKTPECTENSEHYARYQAEVTPSRQEALKTIETWLCKESILLLGAGRNGIGLETCLSIRGMRNLTGIIYESCNAPSMLLDIESLCKGSRFHVASFRCFDSFRGSPYVSSLVLLLPNLKILILPSGIPGSGKTSLGTQIANISRIPFEHIERDAYAAAAKAPDGLRIGRNKARTTAAGSIREKLQSLKSSEGPCAVYMDTCNLNPTTRQAYIDLFEPDITYVVHLYHYPLEAELKVALARVLGRKEHPLPLRENVTRATKFLTSCQAEINLHRHPLLARSGSRVRSQVDLMYDFLNESNISLAERVARDIGYL